MKPTPAGCATGSAISVPGTLLILDEAHHAAPSSGQKYAIDSQITRAVRDLAPVSNTGCFSPPRRTTAIRTASRRCWKSSIRSDSAVASRSPSRILDEVMVRRIKEDLREIHGGFPKRHVVQIDIRRSAG